MRLAIYIGKESEDSGRRIADMVRSLAAGGHDLYELKGGECPDRNTDMLLSVGGDGTFL